MQHIYTPTADGRLRAREDGGRYPEATGTARAFTCGRSHTAAVGVDTGGTLSPRALRLAAPGHTVTYAHDHTSRLIARSETVGETTVTTRYFYDGWNRIAEYSEQDLARTYTWGLNLSRTMQGAGGVGGLLAVRLLSSVSGSSVFFPTYDGNGNVSEYLDEEGIASKGPDLAW